MKIFFKIILFILISINFYSIDFVNAIDSSIDRNDNVEYQKEENNNSTNQHLNNLKTDNDIWVVKNWTWWEWIYNTLVEIAKNMKYVFFMVASIYFVVLVIKLIVWGETDEQVTKFKKWIIWISIWIMITQISYSFVDSLYSKWVSDALAYDFSKSIIEPLIKLLQTWASFVFLAVAIIAFFKMITANGAEEKIKSSKMSILYSIIWFIIIKFSWLLVDTIYWKYNCEENNLWLTNCIRETNLNGSAQIVVTIINWANWFLWILIIILIIYAWLQVVFNIWDEDRLKKAKNTVLYIIVWLFLLVVNYLILTFFIIPESVI